MPNKSLKPTGHTAARRLSSIRWAYFTIDERVRCDYIVIISMLVGGGIR